MLNTYTNIIYFEQYERLNQNKWLVIYILSQISSTGFILNR